MENFEIRINGELQTPTITERTIGLVSHVGAFSLALTEKMITSTSEAFKPVVLDIFDARHNTNLRAEYFARKRQLAEAAMREEVGL